MKMWPWLFACFKKYSRRGNPLGLVLLILGTVLVGICIPVWFWLAALGIGLVSLGWWLYQKWM